MQLICRHPWMVLYHIESNEKKKCIQFLYFMTRSHQKYTYRNAHTVWIIHSLSALEFTSYTVSITQSPAVTWNKFFNNSSCLGSIAGMSLFAYFLLFLRERFDIIRFNAEPISARKLNSIFCFSSYLDSIVGMSLFAFFLLFFRERFDVINIRTEPISILTRNSNFQHFIFFCSAAQIFLFLIC